MRQLILIAFLLLFAHSAHAGWQRIAQMDEPVASGFFFDVDHGLIATGYTPGGSYPEFHIWRTADGGVTWIPSQVPAGVGRITSISMRDTLVGFATIMQSPYSLWRTNDGGKTWFDITGTEIGNGSCVFATPKGVVKTMWEGIRNNIPWDGGGYSADGGVTFKHPFKPLGFTWLNGIDFADDLYGVITPGPIPGGAFSNTLFTSDAGETWNVGGAHPESWGVYAVGGTRMFITLGEGYVGNQQYTVRVSPDGGRSWVMRYQFIGDEHFTGHIAGKCSTLYVQTRYLGMYRSDDLGRTWKNVNGPSNIRDSRFAVTGTNGEVVYAFDNTGGVYKTSDGGDNTLISSPGAKDFSFFPDTLSFAMKGCLQDRKYLAITTPYCSGFILDSLSIVGGDTVFRVDTLTTLGAPQSGSVFIPIIFHYDTTGTHFGKLHVVGRAGTKTVDTLIPLIGVNSTEFAFHIFPDTLTIASKDCIPERGYVTLTTPLCSDFIVDSLSIVSGAPAFRVDTTGMIGGTPSSSVAIPIRFQYDSSGVLRGVLHVRAHAGALVIDTLIVLKGENTFDFKLFCFPDTVFIFTSYCQPKKMPITFSTPICSDLHVDTMYVISAENEFWIDPKDIFTTITPQSRTLPISFAYTTEATRSAKLRIRASRGSQVIDTLIPIVGKNVTCPQPIIGLMNSPKAGDTVHIPIYLRPTQDTFTIKKFIAHLSYNTDMLSCIGSEVVGTLSEPIKNLSFVNDASGVLLTCEMQNTITAKNDLSIPVIKLVMRSYLTSETTTMMKIDAFSVESEPRLGLCSIPEQPFSMQYLCGDSTLTHFMKDSSMPQFISIIPNPAGSGDQVVVKIYLPSECSAAIDVLDGEGNVVSKGEEKFYVRGEHSQMIETHSLASGVYFTRLRLSNGFTKTNRLVIVK